MPHNPQELQASAAKVRSHHAPATTSSFSSNTPAGKKQKVDVTHTTTAHSGTPKVISTASQQKATRRALDSRIQDAVNARQDTEASKIRSMAAASKPASTFSSFATFAKKAGQNTGIASNKNPAAATKPSTANILQAKTTAMMHALSHANQKK